MTVSSPKSTSALQSPLPTPVRVRRKAQPDLYTILLVLSVIAVALAITFLWLSMKSYDYNIKAERPTVNAIHCRLANDVPLLARAGATGQWLSVRG
jgi:hypothetical protein